MPKPGEYNNDCVSLLETENKIKLLEPFKGTKAHHQMQCLVCGHVWSATPLSKRQTLKKYGVSGCPQCNTDRKTSTHSVIRDANLKMLQDRGIICLDDTYDGKRSQQNKKVLFKNINCGHSFYSLPGNLLGRGVECGVCGPKKRTKKLTESSIARSIKWKETATEWEKYKSDASKLTEQTYNKHKKEINPNNYQRRLAGEDGAYHLDHIVPKRFCFDNNVPVEICADKSNLQMIGWRENMRSRDHIKGTLPPIFFPYVSTGTKLEKYASLLQSILPDSKPFVRIADMIVTVYQETSNTAIVVLLIDPTQANMKSGTAIRKSLTEAGVNFIILFEDELTNVALLSSKLKHYTSTSTAERIHARRCTILTCKRAEKQQLLDNHHVQGNDKAHLMYGAYYNNKLVAVMTFAKPRVALGQKKTDGGRWELSRFCTDTNYRIPGIASKLLAHFKRNNTWEEIYSYADCRWSVGNMYTQLGFELESESQPDYYYIIDGVRKHRWNYRKDVLESKLDCFDPNLTEYQNMENNGFYRIWGCGTLKFVMKKDGN